MKKTYIIPQTDVLQLNGTEKFMDGSITKVDGNSGLGVGTDDPNGKDPGTKGDSGWDIW
ncbi:MAG: hypothetical protein IJ064_01830 [Bacteroidaceae bacterium]|nr:hypothetical protein [Bacteroidaceae bacterium]